MMEEQKLDNNNKECANWNNFINLVLNYVFVFQQTVCSFIQFCLFDNY